MNQHIIASLTTALADGQIADDALLIHNAAVNYGHDEMAADELAKFLRSTGYLFNDAMAEAAAAGVEIQLATVPGPRCQRHPYYPADGHGCPICL
jgi:hypothetical protein